MWMVEYSQYIVYSAFYILRSIRKIITNNNYSLLLKQVCTRGSVNSSNAVPYGKFVPLYCQYTKLLLVRYMVDDQPTIIRQRSKDPGINSTPFH